MTSASLSVCLSIRLLSVCLLVLNLVSVFVPILQVNCSAVLRLLRGVAP